MAGNRRRKMRVMIMEWSPEETVTVGGVFGGIILAILTFLRQIGRRADPQIIDLVSKMITANEKSTEMYEKLDGTLDKVGAILEKISADTSAKLGILAVAVDRNAGVTDTLKDTITGKIDTLEGIMIDHANTEPSIADLMIEIKKLGAQLDTVELTVKEIRADFTTAKTQAETIQKRETGEHVVILPDVQTVSKTAAQRIVVEQDQKKVNEQADNPPEGNKHENA